MIILDTDVLSEPLRPAPNERVVAWLDAQVASTLFITTVTLAEVRFGIAAMPPGRRQSRLRERFEDDVIPVFAGRILAFDEPATIAYAALRSKARAAGVAVGDFDALIASIAVTHRFGVATRDTAPYEAAGVTPVVDPFV